MIGSVLVSKIVNGASLQPLLGGKPHKIVLMLHGYGSRGSDLIALAPQWQRQMPHALFLAPNAPQPSVLRPGFQWWPLSGFSGQALAAGTKSAAPAINAFIDRKLDQYGLANNDLAIVGFSQGTMMALHMGLRREHPVAALVGYSGMLTHTADILPAARPIPPILLVHGSADPIVPVAALHAAKHELERLGANVSTHVSAGLGHSVDPVGIRLGCAFVQSAFDPH